MIKFFRKIRQKLLTDNKFGKYLIYAIGEIVLVVIGILIALQINNWNLGRIESEEEKKVLLNLKQDFDFNHRMLDSLISYQLSRKSLHFSILNYTGKKARDISEKEFNILLNSIYNLAEFYPRNGALDDLINSGKLRLIKNEELRNYLSSWSPDVQQLKYRESLVVQGQRELTGLIKKSGSWLDLDEVGVTSTVKTNTFPPSGFDIDNRNLLNQLEFENSIENIIYSNDQVIQRQRTTLDLIDKINKLIENELNK